MTNAFSPKSKHSASLPVSTVVTGGSYILVPVLAAVGGNHRACWETRESSIQEPHEPWQRVSFLCGET